MKIATFNANSVRARLSTILNWLDVHRPDILCLQETKVQDRDFPVQPFREAGYEAVFRGQKAYNGVAILSTTPAGCIRHRLHDGEEAEARFVQAEIAWLTVINLYVPQGVSVQSERFAYKLRWLRDLVEYVERSFHPGQPLLMAGDFNVALEPADVYDPERLDGTVCFHPQERALLRRLLDWGLQDLFRRHHPESGHYTFWDYRIPNGVKRNLGWRIDYLLGTAPLAARCNGAWIDTQARLGPRPSDHTFVVAELEP